MTRRIYTAEEIERMAKAGEPLVEVPGLRVDIKLPEPEQHDFVVGPHGTVWSFEPVSERAKAWVAQYLEIESWQWMGPAFVVDHRPARDLYEGIRNIGFDIEEG